MKKSFKLYYFIFLSFFVSHSIIAQDAHVTFQKNSGSFTLSSSGKVPPIYVSSSDFPGVIRATKNLKTDITNVTDTEPILITDKMPTDHEVIIIGTIGKSNLVDQLIANKKIDVTSIQG